MGLLVQLLWLDYNMIELGALSWRLPCATAALTQTKRFV